MKPNIIYEENINMSPDQVFKVTYDWFMDNKAKIKRFDEPYSIIANHGSAFKMTVYNPGYKKKIKVEFNPNNAGGTFLIVNARPANTINMIKSIHRKCQDGWYNGYFRDLFDQLRRVATPVPIPASIQAAPQFSINEVKDHVRNLPQMYDNIDLETILSRFGITKVQLMPILEDMIFNEGLNARIRNDRLIFKNFD